MYMAGYSNAASVPRRPDTALISFLYLTGYNPLTMELGLLLLSAADLVHSFIRYNNINRQVKCLHHFG